MSNPQNPFDQYHKQVRRLLETEQVEFNPDDFYKKSSSKRHWITIISLLISVGLAANVALALVTGALMNPAKGTCQSAKVGFISFSVCK